MHTHLNLSYRLELRNDEFNLISKALRGTLDKSEIEPAAALQRLMMQQKIAYIKSLAHEAGKLEKNLEEA